MSERIPAASPTLPGSVAACFSQLRGDVVVLLELAQRSFSWTNPGTSSTYCGQVVDQVVDLLDDRRDQQRPIRNGIRISAT